MTITYKNSSPYKSTEQINFYINYLDILSYRRIPSDGTDRQIEISQKFQHRPDLLSYNLYGTVELWWVFMVRNMDIIKDPIYDLTAGKKIYVPTQDRVFSIIGL